MPTMYKHEGDRGGHVIGHTRSGKSIYASESGAYSEVHAKPMGQQHAAVRDHFPRYTAEDHKDAAEVHRNSSGPMAGRYKHMMAAAHDEAASKVAIKSTRKVTIAKAGCGKRTATGGEDGRFAIKNPAASPRDNKKSMKENFDMMKAKYTSRKQGSNGKYEYTYAKEGRGPKTRIGMTSQAASHAARAEGHRADAEQHAANGNHTAAKTSQAKASAHEEQANKYTRMASKIGRDKRRESQERMASPSESEHATRSPGSDKRMATAGEAGRFAIKHPAASPWDNKKSMKENFDMMKAGEMDGINFGEASLPASGASSKQGADNVTELQQVIDDFEAASVGGTQGVKVIEWALHDDTHPTDVDGIATTPVPVDLSANAPGLPFGQTITLNKGHGGPVAPQPFSPLLSTLQFYASQGR